MSANQPPVTKYELTVKIRGNTHDEIEDELLTLTRGGYDGRTITLAPPWKSDDLSRACGVTPPEGDERHTALGDARWVMAWYDAMRPQDSGEASDD